MDRSLSPVDSTSSTDVLSSSASTISLHESFRLLTEAATDYAVSILDPDGLVSDWSAGSQRLEGHEPSQIIGKHFSLLYSARAIADGLPEQELERATSTGRCVVEGYRGRENGSRFWAKVVITAIQGTEGKAIGFGRVVRDLSDWRVAERAQLEADLPFQLMVEAVVDYGLFMIDVHGFVTTWNRGAEKIKGYRAEEIIGKHFSIFYPAEAIRDGLPEHELLLAAKDGRYAEEGWRVRKDGSEIWASVTITALLNVAGELIGYGKVTRDLTERQRAMERTAAAHKQMNEALECMSDRVMTMNHDWVLLYGNRQTLETVPDFRIGKTYWNCFPGILNTPAETYLRNSMENRSTVRFDNYYAPHARWYRSHVVPSSEGLSIFFSDITEEKQMKDKIVLEQILREKRIEALSHMAGGLAHEISNPLAIIHAMASDLRELATDNKPLESNHVLEVSDTIVRTSDRAMRILRGLKGFGREAGQDPMEYALIEGIIGECLELQDARFERHHVQLRLAVAKDLPPVFCRETQIGQIVTNLINNALDAIIQAKSAERWVALAATQLGDNLCIDVTDSGPGVEDQYKKRLMEPFFTTKHNSLGMGIGLSLSCAIAQDHQGSLSLLEETANTRFRLLLPLNPNPTREKSNEVR